MARKFPFEFDFNEDADPVEELHRLREASMKHFKTLDALMEYHRTMPTHKEFAADVAEEIADAKEKEAAEARKEAVEARRIANAEKKESAKQTKTAKQKTTQRPRAAKKSMQRKTAKQMVHA